MNRQQKRKLSRYITKVTEECNAWLDKEEQELGIRLMHIERVKGGVRCDSTVFVTLIKEVMRRVSAGGKQVEDDAEFTKARMTELLDELKAADDKQAFIESLKAEHIEGVH